MLIARKKRYKIQGVVGVRWEEIRESVHWMPKAGSVSRRRTDRPCSVLSKQQPGEKWTLEFETGRSLVTSTRGWGRRSLLDLGSCERRKSNGREQNQ